MYLRTRIKFLRMRRLRAVLGPCAKVWDGVVACEQVGDCQGEWKHYGAKTEHSAGYQAAQLARYMPG